MWDPIEKKLFGTMKLLRQIHMLEKAKLIDSKSKLMNCVDFWEMSLLMKHEACNPQG
jgi:hypothetical protein